MSWYSGGQAALIIVDLTYAGPLLVRARQLDGKSTLTLANDDLAGAARATIAGLVQGADTGDGLALQIASSPPVWSTWFGRLSTTGPGCFGLQVDGTSFSETIVFPVQAGPAPPG